MLPFAVKFAASVVFGWKYLVTSPPIEQHVVMLYRPASVQFATCALLVSDMVKRQVNPKPQVPSPVVLTKQLVPFTLEPMSTGIEYVVCPLRPACAFVKLLRFATVVPEVLRMVAVPVGSLQQTDTL